MEELENSYPWDTIDVTFTLRPEELLTYYLYKYKIDVKNKKENLIKEDIGNIKKYKSIIENGVE